MIGKTEIVLFGITGDLSRQKLIPSLYSLYSKGALMPDARFFGFGRKPFKDAEFVEFIESCVRNKNIQSADPDSAEMVRQFAKRWTYVTSELDSDDGYKELASLLISDSSVIFLSLPPSFQLPVCQKLIENRVIEKKSINDALLSSVMRKASVSKLGRKIALEKPYGSDAASARKLEEYLSSKLDDSQILRVDHYAGKQALVELEAAARQGIFHEILGCKNIKRIELKMLETADVSNRGAFYDDVGAMNDTLQNHLLHMLATFLALPHVGPKTGTGDMARLRSRSLEGLVVTGKPLLGQYEEYAKTSGVRDGSLTETFFNVEAELGSKLGGQSARSIKVRFVGGKALKNSEASIVVTLKNGAHIKILVNGYGTKEAHEQIFEDAIAGNADRFISFKQAMAGWSFVDAVKKKFKDQKLKIVTYKKGIDPSKITH